MLRVDVSSSAANRNAQNYDLSLGTVLGASPAYMSWLRDAEVDNKLIITAVITDANGNHHSLDDKPVVGNCDVVLTPYRTLFARIY